MQADSPYRMQPFDLALWEARNGDDEMVSFSTILSS